MQWAGTFLTGAIVMAVAGCGGSVSTGQEGGDGPVVVLAKAEGWRDGLQEAAGHPYALIEVAANEHAAQRAWDRNVPASLPDASGEPADPGRYATLESVDLDQQAVVVYSSGQSGTCPAWVTDLATTQGRVEVDLGSTASHGQGCTDDFQPYRLVLAVDRDRLPPDDELPVDRVDLPSENLTDVEGRMVAHPAGEGRTSEGNPGPGLGEPANLPISETDRIEVREVATDPWPPWPPAEREEHGIDQGELVDTITEPDQIAPVAVAIEDALFIDLGGLAYDLAPPDHEVVFLAQDGDVLHRLGYYDRLGTWGEHDVEGRWMHGWDLLAVTVQLPDQAR